AMLVGLVWRRPARVVLRLLLLLCLREQAMPAAHRARHLGPLKLIHGVAQVGEFLMGAKVVELSVGQIPKGVRHQVSWAHFDCRASVFRLHSRGHLLVWPGSSV